MKKYIKPANIVRDMTTAAIMAGSTGQIKGEYNSTLPLKSKYGNFYDDDETEF